MVLLAGTEAYHVVLQGLTAVEEVGQGDVDRSVCFRTAKKQTIQAAVRTDTTAEESDANGPS